MKNSKCEPWKYRGKGYFFLFNLVEFLGALTLFPLSLAVAGMDKLPTELKGKIINNLEAKDQFRIKRVNSQMKEIVEHKPSMKASEKKQEIFRDKRRKSGEEHTLKAKKLREAHDERWAKRGLLIGVPIAGAIAGAEAYHGMPPSQAAGAVGLGIGTCIGLLCKRLAPDPEIQKETSAAKRSKLAVGAVDKALGRETNIHIPDSPSIPVPSNNN